MDEEVIVKGSELHQYLLQQGFDDFEVVEKSSSCVVEKAISSREEVLEDDNNDTVFNEALSDIAEEGLEDDTSYTIEEHFHIQIETIMKSKLLFAEDVDAIEIYRQNKEILIRPKFRGVKTGLVATLAAAVAGGGCVYSFQELKNMWLAAASAILSFLSMYLTQLTIKRYKETMWEDRFTSHITNLQQICSKIQKLLRFLRENEIVSSGKVPSANLESVSYLGSRLWESDPKALSSWKTLPQLRKSLSKQIISLAVTISSCSDAIKSVLKGYFKVTYPENSSKIIMYQVLGMNVNVLQDCIPLSDLHKLNEMYLLIQSDYLKSVALCFCSTTWFKKSPEHLDTIYEKMFKMNKEDKLVNIATRLNRQYQIFVLSPKPTSNTLVRNPSLYGVAILNELHKVLLHLCSLISEFKEYEDTLEEMEEEFLVLSVLQNHSHMLNAAESTFQHIKSSLTKAGQMSRKALKISETVGSNKSEPNEQTSHPAHEDVPTTSKIEIGLTSYEVNTDDVDVFFSTCGDASNQHFSNDNDFSVDESSEDIGLRRFVLKELIESLEKRKSVYDQKIRLAMERKGLPADDLPEETFTQTATSNVTVSPADLKVVSVDPRPNIVPVAPPLPGTTSDDKILVAPPLPGSVNLEAVPVNSESTGSLNFSDQIAKTSRFWGLSEEIIGSFDSEDDQEEYG